MVNVLSTSSRNGVNSILYAMGGSKKPDGNEYHNESVSGINVVSSYPVIPQFDRIWKKAFPRIKSQVRIINQEFGKEETEIYSPTGIDTAQKIGIELVEKYYSHRQAIVFTQRGKAHGLIRNNIIINNVSEYHYEACSPEQNRIEVIQKRTDEIYEKYQSCSDNTSTESSEAPFTGTLLGMCVDFLFEYSIQVSSEQRAKRFYFPANQLYDQLLCKLELNNIPADKIHGITNVLDMLKVKGDESVQMKELYNVLNNLWALDAANGRVYNSLMQELYGDLDENYGIALLTSLLQTA